MQESINQSNCETEELLDMPVIDEQADTAKGGPASDLAAWRNNFGVTG